MIYREQGYHFPISVVKVEGWHHGCCFPETGNIWVPSMHPRFETALVYTGTCLFEGTLEGRGTTAPFEIIGAPYVDAYRFSQYMNSKKLPGVFRPVYFTPFYI